MRPLITALVCALASFGALAFTTPGVAAGQEPAATDGATDEIDWRGLHRMDERGHSIKRKTPKPPNPIRELAQSAPYRVHVATSDGLKVTITDAYTLERWRLFAASAIHGYAFSNDGYWLYIVHDAGVLSSIAVPTGKARKMATLPMAEGEVVVEVRGHGTRGHRFVTVVVARGPKPVLGQPCGKWTRYRRFSVRFKSNRTKATTVIEKGPHDLRRKRRRKGTSANTRYEVILGKSLMLNNKIGGGSVGKLNRKALPRGSFAMVWMRDSRGVVVKHGRPAKNGCRYRMGLRSFRQPASQRAAWKRQQRWPSWTLPADVQLVRGDLSHQDPSWAPDQMRLVGVRRGIPVLIEPVPRHRGHVAPIAPPTTLWPVVRPGVRALASGTGALRHAEILAEQGDLDSARRQLAAARTRIPKPESSAVAALTKRLAVLEEMRRRRALEFGLPDASMRGRREIPGPGAVLGAQARPTAGGAPPDRPEGTP